MIYHIIRFKLPRGTTPDGEAAFVRSLEDFARASDAGKVVIGRIEDPHVLVDERNIGDLDGGYTHALMVIFEDEAAYGKYVASNAFRDHRRAGVPLCERVAGFDLIDDWDEGTPARIRAIRATVLRPPSRGDSETTSP